MSSQYFISQEMVLFFLLSNKIVFRKTCTFSWLLFDCSVRNILCSILNVSEFLTWLHNISYNPYIFDLLNNLFTGEFVFENIFKSEVEYHNPHPFFEILRRLRTQWQTIFNIMVIVLSRYKLNIKIPLFFSPSVLGFVPLSLSRFGV